MSSLPRCRAGFSASEPETHPPVSRLSFIGKAGISFPRPFKRPAFRRLRRAARAAAVDLTRSVAALPLCLPLLLGLSAGAQAQTASLVLNPTEIQADSLDGATITLIPKNSTFLGGGGGGVVGSLNIHADEYKAGGGLKNPTGEARLSAAGLARITLSGAPAGLTIASGRLLAREQPHSHGGGTKGHRSARITLAYSGPEITVDDPVTVTVRGGSDSGLLRWGDTEGNTFPPNLSADFTIRAGGVAVSRESLSVPENQTSTYTVALKSAPSGNVVISATSGATSTATVSPSTRTFTSSDWSTPKTFNVTGRGAGTTAISHAVRSTADTAAYPTTTAIPGVAVTVTAPPTADLTELGGTTLPEGAGTGFNILLSRHLSADETVTLPLTVGGTAGRSDYRLVCVGGNPAATCNGLGGASPSITFHGARMPCNDSRNGCRRITGPFRIEMVEDNTAESDETVTLRLGGGRQTRLTVRDAPSSVVLSFLLERYTTPEGLTVIQPTLKVDAAPGRDIAVPLVFTDITATEGEDYTAVATMTFEANGKTVESFDLEILDDTACEGDETFRASIDASRLPAGVRVGARRSAVMTIRDDDTCTIGFAGASYSVTEGGDVSVTVNIDPPRATDTEVDIVYRGADEDDKCGRLRREGIFACGKAYDRDYAYDNRRDLNVGKDYESSPKSVTIPANAGSHTFTVRTVDESPEIAGDSNWVSQVVEPDETFVIAIDPLPDWHSAGAHPTTTVTIRDNDGATDTTAPRVSSIVRHSPSSPSTAADTLTWRVTFDEAVRNVDAGDFTVSGTTATLAVAPVAGANAYDVTASGGDLAGLDGTVTLGFASGQDIGDASGNALSDTTPTGTNDNSFMVNNTSPPPPQLPVVTVSAGTSPVTEGTNADFTVSRTGATTSALTVLLEVSENTAGGRDFVAAGDEGDKSVTIPAGSATASWSVPTVGDGTDEPDGTVTVSLRGSNDYTQGSPSSASVTVTDNDGTTTTPTVTISADASPVTEGTAASFTVSANPAPNAPLNVSVAVTQNGDFAASGAIGTNQTVTIPANQTSATYTVGTVNDSTDEANGRVTVTVTDGTDYTVGSPASATVAVTDNDDPPAWTPVVRIAGGPSITEGGTATFTLTATPAPAQGQRISVRVDVTDSGRFATNGQTGTRTVTIDDTGTAQLTVGTEDDRTDEANGSLTATILAGNGYSPSNTQGAGTIPVTDNDGGTGESTGDGERAGGDLGPPTPVATFAAATARLQEGAGTHDVTVTLEPALAAPLTLTYTLGGTAEHGRDYTLPPTRSLAVAAHQATVTIPVALRDDAVAEGSETLILTLTAGTGYTVGPTRVHTLTLTDNDTAGVRVSPATMHLTAAGETATVAIHLTSQPRAPVTVAVTSSRTPVATVTPATLTFASTTWQTPQRVTVTAGTEGLTALTVTVQSNDAAYTTARLPALPRLQVRVGADLTALTNPWLARFGRTVTGQAVTGITARLSATRTPGLTGTVAGLALDRLGDDPATDQARLTPEQSDPPDPRLNPGGQLLNVRDLLAGSAFALTSAPSDTGGSYALWGQGAWTRFAGQAGPQKLDGDILSGTLGVDWAQGPWVLGVAVSHTQGEGDASSINRHGDLESSLTLVTPYVGVDVTERVTLWGTLGYGRGTLALNLPTAGEMETDTLLLLAAGGVRERLLEPDPTGGLALAIRSEARWLRTTAEATEGVAESEADVGLFRLGLEGTWRQPLADGGSLVPRLDLSLRQDTGEAETGLGLEMRAGVRWDAPAQGLTMDLTGQTLLAHSDREFEAWGGTATVQWDPDPGSAAGPSLTLRQTYGAVGAHGVGTFWTEDPVGLLPTPGPADLRLTAEFDWGLPLQSGLGVPHVAYGWAPASRDLLLGWRLLPARLTAMTLDLTATYREAARTAPSQGVALSLTRTW